jgi:hypothetical protein
VVGKEVVTALGPGPIRTTGTLAITDARALWIKGHHYKVYTYQMNAGTTYTIDMVSPVIDPVLRLEDPQGNVVGEDDDSGVGELDARIVHRAAQTGTYRIIATHYDARRGHFELRISP